MDSPSPSAFSVPVDQVNSLKTNEVKVLDSAVSPTLLKSKLELVIKSNERERRHLSEYRLHSWPETEDKLNQGVREHRCNSDVSWQRRGDKTIITSSSDTSSDDNALCHHHVIIPRIAIINASNFQSNESSVHLQQQDERLQTNFLQSDATSGEGSSLELDEQEYIKEKLENNQDSGLDTLDVEERLSRGFSSNETTSTLPLDSEKEDFGKLRRFNENSEEKEKIRRFDGNDEGKIIFCGKREGERLNEEKEGDKRLGVIEDDDNDGRDVKEAENDQEMIFDDKSETTPPQICTSMLEDDGSDNMRVKAYRVTQRCRRDIVKRRSCCSKCCCIIS
uniref:Uncharacterized protein n=1 Tax=Bracon brevicornis TaxID=1563983 RepID=A0A6V7ILU8_9HYME